MYCVDDIHKFVYHFLLKKRTYPSKETNKAILIPESLIHQHAFLSFFLLNNGSCIVTLGTVEDQLHIDGKSIYMMSSSANRITIDR